VAVCHFDDQKIETKTKANQSVRYRIIEMAQLLPLHSGFDDVSKRIIVEFEQVTSGALRFGVEAPNHSLSLSTFLRYSGENGNHGATTIYSHLIIFPSTFGYFWMSVTKE